MNVTDYWMKHFNNQGVCGLCAQSGVIHTRRGGRFFCICPTGQFRREHGTVAQTYSEDQMMTRQSRVWWRNNLRGAALLIGTAALFYIWAAIVIPLVP